MSWVRAGRLDDIAALGARVLRVSGRIVALFRTSDDRIFALEDSCPHRGGPLSQGIVHGTCVTCPLHDWVIDLTTGEATGADDGRTPTFPTRIIGGSIYVYAADQAMIDTRKSYAPEAEAALRASIAGE